MIRHFLQEIYPQKCVLCQRILPANVNDLCHTCRKDIPQFTYAKKKISFVAGWVCLWYYSGVVRHSLLQFKFHHKRSNGKVYGRLLAMRLMDEGLTDFDVLTYVPISFLRKLRRGYDQMQVITKYVAEELGVPYTRTLIKRRHNPAQSGIVGVAQRRANVLNTYRVAKDVDIQGKKILLLDDIITTGSTLSECARVLLTAGASEVKCAAVAASEEITKVKR